MNSPLTIKKSFKQNFFSSLAFPAAVLVAAFSTSAVAEEAPATPALKMKCVIQEILNGTNKSTEINIAGANDPHGTIQHLRFENFKDISGMVALMDTGMAVLSLYHETLEFNTASHSDVSAGKPAHLQLLMSNDRGIVIDCAAE